VNGNFFVDDNNSCTGGATTSNNNNNVIVPASRSWRRNESRGRKCLLPARLVVALKAFFDTLMDEDYGASLRIMVSELGRLSHECTQEFTDSAINSRVYRL
jgi:hypothetical protein